MWRPCWTTHPHRNFVWTPLPSLGVRLCVGGTRGTHSSRHQTRFVFIFSPLVGKKSPFRWTTQPDFLNKTSWLWFHLVLRVTCTLILLPGTRTELSSCRWKQTCAMRMQKPTSPTFPITTWCRLKPTSWNEELNRVDINYPERKKRSYTELCNGQQFFFFLHFSVNSSAAFSAFFFFFLTLSTIWLDITAEACEEPLIVEGSAAATMKRSIFKQQKMLQYTHFTECSGALRKGTCLTHSKKCDEPDVWFWTALWRAVNSDHDLRL